MDALGHGPEDFLMPDRRCEFEVTIDHADNRGTRQCRQVQIALADRWPPFKPCNAGCGGRAEMLVRGDGSGHSERAPAWAAREETRDKSSVAPTPSEPDNHHPAEGDAEVWAGEVARNNSLNSNRAQSL